LGKEIQQLELSNQSLRFELQKSQTENNILRVRASEAESGCRFLSSSEGSFNSDISSTVHDYERPVTPGSVRVLQEELQELHTKYNEMEEAFNLYRRETIQEQDTEEKLSEELTELYQKYESLKTDRDAYKRELDVLRK